jgi:hypothetical protein
MSISEHRHNLYGEEKIKVVPKEKKELPLLLEMGKSFDTQKIPRTESRRLTFPARRLYQFRVNFKP